MAIAVKICGLTDERTVRAAVVGGARYLGFVFYPPSPRALDVERAAALAASAGNGVAKVGVFVDPDDALLAEVLARVPLDHLQLHGVTPERIAEVRARTGCRVIGAVSIATAEDLAPLPGYAAVADLLLFDARPPRAPGWLPGGNALRFDWRLLDGLEVGRPWLLAGGLSAANLAEAVRRSGAPAVDVSSGVERRPGEKDPALIRGFLELAAGLG
jgi:phosphoribosylanthranilate isomerase